MNEDASSISGLFKSIFMVIILILALLFHFRKKYSFFPLFILVQFLFFSILMVNEHGKVTTIKEISFFIKVLTPIIAYYFFSIGVHRYHRTYLKILSFTFLVIAINLILGVFGYGFDQYDGNIGSTGFFFAGNELSTLFIIACAGVSIYFSRLNLIKKVVFYMLFIFLAVIKSTKTAIIAIIFLIIKSLISAETLHQIVDYKKKVFPVFITIFMVLGGTAIATSYISDLPVLQRWEEIFSTNDITTAVYSSRNIYLQKSLNILQHDFSTLNWFFGKGFTVFQEMMARFFHQPHTIEIDIFDIFFSYGICFTAVLLLHYGYFLLKMIRKSIFLKNHPYNSYVFFTFLLLIFVSTFAGHVFTSGIAGIQLGMLLSLSNYEKEI